MAELTEIEIFSCLEENFRLAAEYCEILAVTPKTGPTYRKLRESLQLLEGACRQASAWREDTRWLKIGMFMGEAHKKAGGWLRGIKVEGGPNVKLADAHKHPLFLKLAENLRAAQKQAHEFKTKCTGTVGMILPEMQKPETRTQGRSMQVKLPSGLIVPRSALH